MSKAWLNLLRFVQCAEMYGGPIRIPVPDVDGTDYFLIVGANPFSDRKSERTPAGFCFSHAISPLG